MPNEIRTTARRSRLLLAAALLLAAPASAQPGPGLGNLTYSGSELLQPVASIVSPTGHGMVAMLNGYLFVPFSNDGNFGVGGFEFYDVSDPRNPVLVSRTRDAATEPLLEPHLYGFHYAASGKYLAYVTRDGVSIWDMSDVFQPLRVASLTLPGFGTSGYDGVPWGAFWQAPYLFVGGTNQGLYVVDTTDLSAPRMIAHLPAAQLGGFRVGMVYALGNLLAVTAVDTSGLATLDISNPFAPQLLAVRTDVPHAYASLLDAGRIYSAGADAALRSYDVSDPTAILDLAALPTGLGPGGYQAVQDGFLFGGFSTGIAKFDLIAETLVGTATSGIVGRDEDFVTPLGNLVFAGSDHYGGSAFIVHDTAPDTTPPVPRQILPADGAVDLAVTSRVGIRFSDEIDLDSVGPSSFVVRETGGLALPGWYSGQNGFVSFTPQTPLAPGATYEIVLPAGGIRDWAGNVLATSVTTSFTTTTDVPPPALALDGSSGPIEVGGTAEFESVLENPTGTPQYSFDFGDGSPATPFSPEATASHMYSDPGNHRVTLTAQVGSETLAASFIQVVHRALIAGSPRSSANLSLLEAWNLLAAANTDNDSVTLVDRTSLEVVAEIQVAGGPTSLALAPSGDLWVVCRDAAEISVIDLASRTVTQHLPLPRASRPQAIVFDAAVARAYVTLEATGELLRLSLGGSIEDRIAVGPTPRGLALTADGADLWVSRFVSPASEGRLSQVDASSLALVGQTALALDPGPDTEASGRGVPNYLGPLVISPDGSIAVVPSVKDNVERGGFRDGLPLTFESSVRAILSWIDPGLASEVPALRVDFNDSAMPAAAAFSRLGNLVYVAMQSSGELAVVDTYRAEVITTVSLPGIGAGALVLDAQNGRLFAHDELSRTLEVRDVGLLETLEALDAPPVASIPLVSSEKLSSLVLQGKRIFYDAGDPRMSRDAYLSCSVCHLDGMSDERVWDFTDRGQGFRRTISLLGRAGTRLGPVHWTANFDEIQDFEGDIRTAFAGTGLMADPDYALSAAPLGPPKAGLSPELDALAAYVASLDRAPASPYRQADARLTAAAERGRQLFFGAGECAVCHAGPHFTDQERHDVGTLQPHSGSNGAQLLAGIGLKTPALTGVWQRGPFLHDGSAATLHDVVASATHGAASTLAAPERDDLVAFLREIEGPPPPVQTLIPSYYEVGRAGPTERLYVDRDYTIESLPSDTVGMQLIRTVNDDKDGSATSAIQLQLATPARVLVAFDDRATSIPPWLQDWSEVPGAFIEYAGGNRLRLYQRTLPAGPVALGGNQPATGAASMYVVLVESVPSVADLAPAGYATASVAFTQRLYVDRDYTIEDAPAATLGSTLIRTANDDKGSSDPGLVHFILTTAARVLVAFDDRATSVPAWLQGWSEVPGDRIVYGGGNLLRLYEKVLPAGPVVLGGNQPAPGASSMYVVLVAPLEAPPFAPQVPALGAAACCFEGALLYGLGLARLRRRRRDPEKAYA